MILSAMHGLVDPEERLAPCDLALSDLDAHERRAWGDRAANALEQRFGDLIGIMLEMHAGDAYRRAVELGVLARGGRAEAPLRGLPLGSQIRVNASRSTAPAELSDGLGHQVHAGRIYTAQTGATKWPSGTAGAATLASRIGGSHLHGRIADQHFV
jgi:hypothetical protein